MEGSLERITSKAMALPASSRAALAKKLLDSLEPELEQQDDFEIAWAKVAELRFQDIKAGQAKTKSASDVMREARARFKH